MCCVAHVFSWPSVNGPEMVGLVQLMQALEHSWGAVGPVGSNVQHAVTDTEERLQSDVPG